MTESQFALPGKNELRCSSLPYCPILDIMHQGEDFIQEYDMAFFTEIGTAYHTVAQAHMVAGKFGHEIWGDWQFEGEKKIYKNCFRPKPKKVDGRLVYPKYLEVSIKFKNLSGHCDMVWCHEGIWYLLDFKTTSNAVLDPKNSSYYPDPKHKIQLSAYFFILNHLKIPVSKVCLMYVSRNRTKEWDTKTKKKVSAYKIIPFKPKKSVFKHVKRSCSAKKAVNKFMDGDDNAIYRILELKPCQVPSDFFTGIMEKKFFGNEKCPYLSQCFGKKIVKMMKEKRKELKGE